ncbi:MAG: hypothetical protein ACRDRE_23440 [Pseudonocardiaceae bacterium]
MLVVLDDLHTDLRDLMLLVAIDHPQVPRAGQVRPTPTATLREPILKVIGSVDPGQVRSRRPGLLALGLLRTNTTALVRRRGPARIIIL